MRTAILILFTILIADIETYLKIDASLGKNIIIYFSILYVFGIIMAVVQDFKEISKKNNMKNAIRFGDVSAWREYGKLRGYWKYFKDEIKEEIKKDLLAIADKGELEELRREVNNYFK
jgi:hypothetical protein